MKIVYEFIILYIIMFLIDYVILKQFHTNELEYMKLRFKLKKTLKQTKKIKIICSLINSFIISIVVIFSLHCKWNLAITLLVDFVLLILLIYSIYGVFGNILKKEKSKKIKLKKH